jgi:hypothetical protein
MPLPFTVVCEPPPFLARTWRIWVLVGGLAVAASAFLFYFLFGPPAGAGPEVGGATLRVESEPPRATVEIDGRARGHTPLTVAVAPGERRVGLRLDGYAEATYTVRLETGQSAMLAGELWLRSPEVRRLRPAFPGAAIAGATFLDDGRIALIVALPPGDERQLWLLARRGGAQRVGPPQARGSIAISPDGARVAYLAPGEGAGPGGPLRELWLAGSGGERGSRRFVLPTGDERLVDLSWAPDSQHLLVVSREQRAGGGQRFDEDMVAAIIRNPVYKGFVRYGGMLYPGKHEAIVDEETWEEANKAIGNGREDDTGLYYTDPHIHLLKGILRCGACGRAMTPYHSGKRTKDGTPYRYYACVDYTKDGSQTTCPVKMLPAREFEALIKQALADLGNHPAILEACVDTANREAAQSLAELEAALGRHREEAGRLTRSIRRLIDVMKQEDLLAEDIKDEYRRLVREQERLQARCAQLEFDLERHRKRVLDADLIRRALQDFERLVGVLPLVDQKELFQLLVREVVVWPFEPEREAPQDAPSTASPNGRAGATAAARAFTAKIRTRWYRVRIALYQLPNLANPTSVNHSARSSGFGGIGSRGRIRTYDQAVNSRPLYR